MSSAGTRMAPGQTKVETSYQRHIVFPQCARDVQVIVREHKWKIILKRKCPMEQHLEA